MNGNKNFRGKIKTIEPRYVYIRPQMYTEMRHVT